jgi:hypothetical protein
MANAEMQLLSRIVRTGELGSVIDWGVVESDFRTNEGKSIWRYIAGYYAEASTRGSVIGERIYGSLFPQIPLYDDASMTLPALCHELRRGRIVAEAKEACLALSDTIEGDPIAAIAALHVQAQNLIALGTTKNHDVPFVDSMTRMLAKYEQIKNGVHTSSRMRWPWEILNDHTMGIHEEDFIVLFGRPKSMKTWVLNYIMASAFMQDKTALIYTKEMTPDSISQRTAACIAQLPYQELRSGKLLPHDEYNLSCLLNAAQDKYSRANLIFLDGREVGAGNDTVPWIESKIEKYKPHIVFIDGMYLLSDTSKSGKTADWQRVTNISRAVRNMVLHTRTPVIATMQATRGAAKHSEGNLDEIAYADAVAQDATIAMRVINEKHLNTIACVIAGSREFKLHGFRIHGVPATNFTFHSEMSESDISEAEKRDTPEEAAKKKARKVRGRTDDPNDEQSKNMKKQLTAMVP